MELLFIISMGVRLVMGLFLSIFGKIFVKSWLNWIEKRFSKAIITLDFRINFVAGTNLPALQLVFQVHNGTISAINLKGIVLNLYSADAYITTIAGPISDISLIHVPSTKIGRGEDVDVTVDVVPPLEFWLPPRATSFSLRKSSIVISTVWGNIIKPLEPDHIQDDIQEFEKQIDGYISKVGRALSV